MSNNKYIDESKEPFVTEYNGGRFSFVYFNSDNKRKVLMTNLTFLCDMPDVDDSFYELFTYFQNNNKIGITNLPILRFKDDVYSVNEETFDSIESAISFFDALKTLSIVYSFKIIKKDEIKIRYVELGCNTTGIDYFSVIIST